VGDHLSIYDPTARRNQDAIPIAKAAKTAATSTEEKQLRRYFMQVAATVDRGVSDSLLDPEFPRVA
jgi:hypothetical protein